MVVNKRNCLIGILLMMLLLLPASSAQAATLTRVGLSINGSTVRLTGTGNLLDSQGNIMAHLTGTNACEVTASLGQLWLGGASFSQLRVVPTGAGAQSYLQVNGKAYRGELVISASSSGIKVVNEVDLEDYLLGVVALEMTPTWPLEALKAQAVAARTFALKNIGRHLEDGFDLCDSSHCQVYGGIEAERPIPTAAVKETDQLVLRYDGELVEAFYHASSGGRTETAGNVWGQDRPYLTPVEDGTDLAGPYAFWEEKFTSRELSERLAQAGYPVGSVQQIKIIEKTCSGRAATVQVIGSLGTTLIPGTRFRQVLNLKSTLFDVTVGEVIPLNEGVNVWVEGSNNTTLTMVAAGTYVVAARGIATLDSRLATGTLSRGDDAQTIVLQGSGYGHGVGMSQWGAKLLAENLSFDGGGSFEYILTHYYNGVTIEPY